MSFLQISFSGAVLIFVMLLIRTFAGSRLPKKILLCLWWIVLFRLFVPFFIPSAFSIYSLISRSCSAVLDMASYIPSDTEVVTESSPAFFDDLPSVQNEAASVFEGAETAPDHLTALANHMPVMSVWFLIWCVGAGVCAAFFLTAWLRCRFEFQTSLPVNSPFIENWLKEHPLKRPLSIRLSDKINAPLTYGVFRPVILLPKKMNLTDIMQLRYILMHEYMHISRFDILMKFVSTTALCLHWFNPLVWVMHAFLNRDIELACDESVIFRFGTAARSSYAETLLHMEAQRNGIAPFYSSFNKHAIEERILSIMKIKNNPKKTTILSCTIAAALLIFAAVFFSTTAAAKTDTSIENASSGAATSGLTASNTAASDHSGAAFENTVTESAADSDYNPDDFLPASKADFSKDGELLHNYEQFGISYDADGKIYYNGQLVRYFWDGAEIKEDNEVIGWSVRYEYLNQEGTVDVHTIRKTEYYEDNSINVCGPVTGMKQSSKKEFESRDIQALLDPDRTAVAEETETFDIDSSFRSAAEDSTIPYDTAEKIAEDEASVSTESIDVYFGDVFDAADSETDARTLAEIFADYAPLRYQLYRIGVRRRRRSEHILPGSARTIFFRHFRRHIIQFLLRYKGAPRAGRA